MMEKAMKMEFITFYRNRAHAASDEADEKCAQTDGDGGKRERAVPLDRNSNKH